MRNVGLKEPITHRAELIDSLEHNGTVYHALFPAEQEGEEQEKEKQQEEFWSLSLKERVKTVSIETVLWGGWWKK